MDTIGRIEEALKNRDIELLHTLKYGIAILTFTKIIVKVVRQDNLEDAIFLFREDFISKRHLEETAVKSGSFKIVQYMVVEALLSRYCIKYALAHSIEMCK